MFQDSQSPTSTNNVLGTENRCALAYRKEHGFYDSSQVSLYTDAADRQAWLCANCRAQSKIILSSYLAQAKRFIELGGDPEQPQGSYPRKEQLSETDSSPVGHLWAQAEKKVSERCDACGHLLEVGYSTKHQSWLCREHFNHHNVEDMIFGQKVLTNHKCHFDGVEGFNHSLYDGNLVQYDTRFGLYLCDKCIKSSDDVIANMLDRMKSRQTFLETFQQRYHDNDAIDTNEQGGKQSHLEYSFELMDPEFMLRVAHVLWVGKQKYGAYNWHSIPMEENIGRAMYHLEQALLGQDHSEDHFANAVCRVMFAAWKAEHV